MCPAETIVIVGPTGAGKTDLSLRLAELVGGEIVGLDAFQIYRGLPLLTSQPSTAQQARVPHHLIGSVDPGESFDAGRYRRTAGPILQDVVGRGRIPILVGGTGLYLKALLGGIEELPGSNPALREEFSRLDLPLLIERLRSADPKAEAIIDLANRRRVERALEIILLTGKPLMASRTASQSKSASPMRGILLLRDREELYARIETNIAAIFARGVESEVAGLTGKEIGATAAMTLGLREIQAHSRGEISREEAMIRIIQSTRRYARRQITWFKNQHSFPTLNLSNVPADEALDEALRLLRIT